MRLCRALCAALFYQHKRYSRFKPYLVHCSVLHEHGPDGVVDVSIRGSAKQLSETNLRLLCRRTAAHKHSNQTFCFFALCFRLNCACCYLLLLPCGCRLTSRAGTICSMWRGSQMLAWSSSSTVFLTTPCRPRIPDTRILDAYNFNDVKDLILLQQCRNIVLWNPQLQVSWYKKNGFKGEQTSQWFVKTAGDWLEFGVGVVVVRVTHLTEARHEEVVAAMVWRCVLFNIGKLQKLHKK